MNTGDSTQGEDHDVQKSIYASGICQEHADKMQSFECLELVTYFYIINSSAVIGLIRVLLNQSWFHSFCLQKSFLKAR